jgi:Spy/CpxP family protein refolding chaperone
MARQTAWVLAVALACAVPATGASQPAPQQATADKKDRADRPEQRDRWKWWLYDRVELGISDQQSAAINEIFESTISRLRDTRREADRAESELSKTIKENVADVTTVSQLVDRYEAARSENNKTRVLMLYRMHRELRPEQRMKLEALRERQESRRRQGDEGRKR